MEQNTFINVVGQKSAILCQAEWVNAVYGKGIYNEWYIVNCNENTEPAKHATHGAYFPTWCQKDTFKINYAIS